MTGEFLPMLRYSVAVMSLLLWLPGQAALLVAGIGDSIMEGHCAPPMDFAAAKENGGIETGDTNMSPMHVLAGLSGGGLVTTNIGRRGFKWADVNNGLKQLIPRGTGWVVAHCGVNDVSQGVPWEMALAHLNSIKSHCDSLGAKMLIDDIFPWTAGKDPSATEIRGWNSKYHEWAATNGAFTLRSHDAMGQIRKSTGELDDMLASFDCDKVHINTSAVALWANNIFSRLQELTNPFKISSKVVAPAKIEINWPAVVGQLYQIQKDDSGQGNWRDAGTPVQANVPKMTWSDQTTNRAGFYRIRILN